MGAHAKRFIQASRCFATRRSQGVPARLSLGGAGPRGAGVLSAL